MARDRRVIVSTEGGGELAAVEAGSLWRRGVGLMLRRKVPHALVLPRCRAVHAMGVVVPLDVAFYREGAAGAVVLEVRRLVPMVGVRWSWRASGVIEAAAGAFAELGIAAGSKIAFSFEPKASSVGSTPADAAI